MIDTKIKKFGDGKIINPAGYDFYTPEDSCVVFKAVFNNPQDLNSEPPVFFEQAGPREKIWFDPAKVKAGIVTCGGLCPGINDVIRAIVMELHYWYKVKDILGFRYGYEGLVKSFNHPVMNLTPSSVSDIMTMGGSILASSRGHQDPEKMVDYLQELGVNLLFTIGGDGTLRGAAKIHAECERRGIEISVVGIPKTIDNDINYIQRSFGFSTAFSEAIKVIEGAHIEAIGAKNGVGLVKLMGRHSGFIAVHATIASKHVNFCLIPENDFDLEGPGCFLEKLEQRLDARKHAVVVVAEGAGQKFFDSEAMIDKSGNKKLGDIGWFMNLKIKEYFAAKGKEVNVKYFDPSYIIRSTPANADDSFFCSFLGQNAAHAAMSGRTGMVVGYWNNVYTHLPIELATLERKVVNTEKSPRWRAVLASTGQPAKMLNNANN